MKNIPRIHLLYGNQQLRVDETVEAIISSILGDRDRDLCVERFNAGEILKDGGGESAALKIDGFQLSCETPPFLSDLKLIRLDHFDKLKLPKGEKSNSKKSGRSGVPAVRLYQSILRYLSDLPDYCWFIFTSTATREQEISSPLLKAIKNKKGRITKFVSYDNDSPIGFVLDRSRQKGIIFRKESAQLLIDLVGNDLSDLDQELEKLLMLLGTGTEVSEDILMRHIHGNKHFSVFRITQSLADKELLPALETLDQVLMASHGEHIRLFALIAQQFRKLLNIHYWVQKKMNEGEILRKLGVHPFLGKQIIAQSRNFTLEEMENILMGLSEMDLKIKFNHRLARALFQDLFQKICLNKYKTKRKSSFIRAQ